MMVTERIRAVHEPICSHLLNRPLVGQFGTLKLDYVCNKFGVGVYLSSIHMTPPRKKTMSFTVFERSCMFNVIEFFSAPENYDL